MMANCLTYIYLNAKEWKESNFRKDATHVRYIDESIVYINENHLEAPKKQELTELKNITF